MDTIVYGVHCAWWDSIANASKHKNNLPCCPHCRGMLFMMSLEEWNTSVERYEQEGHPGYKDLMNFNKGKCFPSTKERDVAYELSKQNKG